jgi:hypothetical protein
MFRWSFVCAAIVFAVGVTRAADPPAPIRQLNVYPRETVLTGPRAEQRLGVLGIHTDGRESDRSRRHPH